jgi:hypothetical protein
MVHAGTICPSCQHVGLLAWLFRASQLHFVAVVALARVFSIRNGLRGNGNFLKHLNCIAAFKASAQKYSTCNFLKISNYYRIPPHRRGAYASSRYVECGLWWT